MVENRSAPGAMIVNLCYEDLAYAIEWLVETFGFAERYRYGPPDQAVGAQLQLEGAVIMLFTPRVGQGTAEDFTYRVPRSNEASHAVSVRVDDVDAHHDRSRERGAMIVQPLETYRFGERQYSVVDFAGHMWTFSQSVADVAPEDWGARIPDG